MKKHRCCAWVVTGARYKIFCSLGNKPPPLCSIPGMRGSRLLGHLAMA